MSFKSFHSLQLLSVVNSAVGQSLSERYTVRRRRTICRSAVNDSNESRTASQLSGFIAPIMSEHFRLNTNINSKFTVTQTNIYVQWFKDNLLMSSYFGAINGDRFAIIVTSSSIQHQILFNRKEPCIILKMDKVATQIFYCQMDLN